MGDFLRGTGRGSTWERKVTLDYVLNHHRHNSHRNSPYSDSETYTVQSLLVEAGMGVVTKSKEGRWEME